MAVIVFVFPRPNLKLEEFFASNLLEESPPVLPLPDRLTIAGPRVVKFLPFMWLSAHRPLHVSVP